MQLSQPLLDYQTPILSLHIHIFRTYYPSCSPLQRITLPFGSFPLQIQTRHSWSLRHSSITFLISSELLFSIARHFVTSPVYSLAVLNKSILCSSIAGRRLYAHHHSLASIFSSSPLFSVTLLDFSFLFRNVTRKNKRELRRFLHRVPSLIYLSNLLINK